MPDSTPIVYKVSGTEPFTDKMTLAQERNFRLEAETRGKWVGGMDAGVFLGRYLPPVNSNVSRPALDAKAFAKIPKVIKEDQMYGPFINVLSPYAPHLKLVDVHARVDTRCEGIAVDIGAYQLDTNSECNIEKCDFSQMQVPIELKLSETSDPFNDYKSVPGATEKCPYPFEHESVECMAIRGQIASYSSALIGAQFCLHAFSVFIAGPWARLLRWDRNGVIVTRRFLYAEDDSLVEFFWRYAHAPPHNPFGPSRGSDPTVRRFYPPAQTQAEKEARDVLQKINADAHREFRVMMIPDRDNGEEFPFLISFPPRYVRHSPFGRATRPALAFDLKNDKMVFIKDYWRSTGDNLEKEGDIYKILEAANVPYLAPFGRGNDVRKHITHTDTVRNEAWAYPSANMVPLHQYRMSLDEVARPLNEFDSSHQLVTAIADAMEAHELAYHDANILHRDISAGNILITKKGRGMLIDWDLCLNLNNLKGKARRPDRTGTWQYLSVFLLQNLHHLHDVLDDKESSLYVLLWNVLGYTPHNMTHRMEKEMALFDQPAAETCAALKEAFLRHNKRIKFPGRPCLESLIQEICRTLRVRYDDDDDDDSSIPDQHRPFLGTAQGAIMAPNKSVVRERKLAQKFWLVNIMRKYLEPRSAWPAADKALKNPYNDGEGTPRQIVKRELTTQKRQVGASSLKGSI